MPRIGGRTSRNASILLPIDWWCKASHYWLGTKCYDFLAGNEGIESSHSLMRSKTLEAFPVLRRSDLAGAHNDFRITVSIGVTAALHGASVVNHSRVHEPARMLT
ncbi:glycerol-3-phosphate dehydrogenase [Colletotrichum higginsianum]|nr:glycerol-3-phosphate dehydrogenase [Colletotrichum higginsianum]